LGVFVRFRALKVVEGDNCVTFSSLCNQRLAYEHWLQSLLMQYPTPATKQYKPLDDLETK
jgi:hypothetical protein